MNYFKNHKRSTHYNSSKVALQPSSYNIPNPKKIKEPKTRRCDNCESLMADDGEKICLW